MNTDISLTHVTSFFRFIFCV